MAIAGQWTTFGAGQLDRNMCIRHTGAKLARHAGIRWAVRRWHAGGSRVVHGAHAGGPLVIQGRRTEGAQLVHRWHTGSTHVMHRWCAGAHRPHELPRRCTGSPQAVASWCICGRPAAHWQYTGSRRTGHAARRQRTDAAQAARRQYTGGTLAVHRYSWCTRCAHAKHNWCSTAVPQEVHSWSTVGT